ncbi:AsmA family protein [Neptuniibacter sp.]|uniref:AsmA family protein n=1 Tax=Neptuniibacter sp. TaxID=1962643 RepID=UPI002605BC4E|nr:AsmA family protein [Neptuniibacter sp.]MCP4598052.1 AsmA family protein [Neptuniibacter sp.]
MKGLLKLVAGLAALIVVVIVAGGAILGAFFDPNEYKPEIETAALDQGGVELKINGDIGWSVFPWLGLEVNKIDVKFPGKADLASLNQARISVRLPALMSGNVEMESVVVDGLKLNLVKEKDGSANWAAEVSTNQGKTAAESKPANAGEAAGGAAIALDIDSIQITNGFINYQDKTTQTEATLNDFNMTSGQVVTNAFFPAELSFNAVQSVKGEEQIKANAKLSAEFFLDLENQLYKIKGLDSNLTVGGKPFGGKSLELATAADIEADLANQSAQLNNLKFSVANLNATGNVTVKDFAAPQISGKLDVASFELNKLLTAVGQAEVKTTDPAVLKAISFNTVLEGPANTVTAKAITLKLDDTTFNGSAGFNLANGAITLNLQGDKIDADRYMPPATEGSSEKATSTTGQGYSKAPVIPVEALKALELDAKLGLKALHVSNMDVSNIALQVSAHGGLIKASKIDADLYGGSVRNNVTVDVRNKTPLIKSNKTISGIQIGDMLKAAAQVEQLTGTFNSKSNLTLRGNSVHDFVNSVTGTANVNMKDGEVHGIDMAQTVCQGMNNVSSLGINTKEVDRSTPFANMGASANIKNGVISNKDLKAALDAMVLSGKGTVNLPKQLLDYRLGFMVEKNLFKETCSFPDKLEGVEIPIDCKGSFNTPPAELCKPDFSFITNAMKKQVKEKAKKKVEEKLKGKLGDKLKGLF